MHFKLITFLTNNKRYMLNILKKIYTLEKYLWAVSHLS